MSNPNEPENLLVHGCAIILGRQGLLIRGASGSGKTRTAQLLIEQFQQNDVFACWVADDQVQLNVYQNAVLARVPDTIAGMVERRFSGIEQVSYERSARLDFVVDLLPVAKLERLPEKAFVSLNGSTKPLALIKAPEKYAELAVEIICASIHTI